MPEIFSCYERSTEKWYLWKMVEICRFVDFQEVAPFYTASWDTYSSL